MTPPSILDPKMFERTFQQEVDYRKLAEELKGISGDQAKEELLKLFILYQGKESAIKALMKKIMLPGAQ